MTTEHRGSSLRNKKTPTTKRRRKKAPKHSFARALAEARERKGFTQAEMADLYGAMATVINRIESGRQQIGETTIKRFADALGLRVRLTFVRKAKRKTR